MIKNKFKDLCLRSFMKTLIFRIGISKNEIKKVYHRFYLFRVKVIKNPDETVHVPVEKINYNIGKKEISALRRIGFLKLRATGIIFGEDWDLQKKLFSELNVYNAFQQRFVEGKEWEDTSYYEICK
jgi:hypothetical protein